MEALGAPVRASTSCTVRSTWALSFGGSVPASAGSAARAWTAWTDSKTPRTTTALITHLRRIHGSPCGLQTSFQLLLAEHELDEREIVGLAEHIDVISRLQ